MELPFRVFLLLLFILQIVQKFNDSAGDALTVAKFF